MPKNEQFIKQSRLEDQAHYLLKERGVRLESIAEIVYDLQKDYIDDLTLDRCLENVIAVMKSLQELKSTSQRRDSSSHLS